ncbi:LTA synthase family protein [Cellvibrio japonicus]|nr:LTA synthase family protein [Cellvibrio japonicus]
MSKPPSFSRQISSTVSSLLAAYYAGPYVLLLRMALLAILLLSISRLGLIAWQWDRVSATGQVFDMLLQGIRADMIMICLWLLPAVLLTPCLAKTRIWLPLSYAWGLAGLILMLFMELATPSFVMQYDLRPNRLFIEYLEYPKEVFATLWGGFRVPLLLGIGLCILVGYGFARAMRVRPASVRTWPLWQLWATWPLVIVVVAMGIRSTTGHRPANPALFAITGDALVNSLVISSSYSVVFAAYNMKHEARSSEIYGSLPASRVIEEARQWPWFTGVKFDSQLPTWHQQDAVRRRERPLNLIIVLEESLGATFVESLGGLPVTPRLEALKDKGWWFEQLYATGTRSVRGIEAVVSGFMPTPAQSTVKLSRSQHNFFTLAGLLSDQGYHTEFIYGGEAHFDNMRSFFTGNGFSQVIDIDDMPNAQFVGSWGASDEDLFNHAHQHLLSLHAKQQPFFSLIFTSSNHEPFEFPDGRIDLHEEPEQTVNNAVRYADYALGEFMDKASQSPYWHNTLVLIVADHDNRAYGPSLVPVDKFHIPGLILGADIEPRRIKPIASQIDLGPTLLSLMGVSAAHPMMGRDFARDSHSPGRALIQFDDYFALLEDNHRLTILRPEKAPVAAVYDPLQKRVSLLNEPPGDTAVEKALAHALLPSILYREQKYPGRGPAMSSGTSTLSQSP